MQEGPLNDLNGVGPSPRTLRMYFVYEGDRVDLVDLERVEMMPDPSEHFGDQEQAGFWYELQDAEGCVLYRRVVESPLRSALEVPTGDPEQPLAWQEMDTPGGEFVLFAPHIDEAESIVFFSSPLSPQTAIPLDREGAGMPAREICRFSLGEVEEGERA
jgi:hypothetical protein